MTVAGICMVRDAGDIVVAVVAHMLRQVDVVVIADNLSTDETRPTLDRLAEAGRLVILDDVDPAHRQSAKTTALAAFARDLGASWVVPFDSDEVWYSPFGRIADELARLPSHIFVASADLYDHVATGADDPTELDPARRLGWRRRKPSPLVKVACRTAEDLTIADGNHSARYGLTGYEPPATVTGRLIIRHFPYRTAEQMAAKARIGAAALRAAPELDEDTGKHWRDYDALGPELLADVFAEHYYAPSPHDRTDLIYDPAPV